MEKVLLFQLSDKDRQLVEKISSNMRIKVLAVEKEKYRQKLGWLAGEGRPVLPEVFDGVLPEGSMLVFCNLTDKHMDKMLFELRSRNADITYKAALTPVNAKWNVLRMYAAMEQEKKEMAQSGRTPERN